DGHLEFGSGCRRQIAQCRSAAQRIDAARIGYNAQAARLDVLQECLHHTDKIGGVTLRRVLLPCADQERHGHLGEIVEHQVVDLAALRELTRPEAAVTPEAGCASDANDPVSHTHLPVQFGFRFSLKAATPSAASSVIEATPICVSVKLTACSNPIEAMAAIAYLPRRMAVGDLSVMRSTSQFVFSSSSAAGTA